MSVGDRDEIAPIAIPSTRRRLGRRTGLRIAASDRMPPIVFGWAQLVLLMWWAGEYPGLVSADSVRYVIHVTTGPWTADHSVLYDSSVLVSLDLTNSVWLLTLVQTTAAAAVLAYTAAAVQAFGVRARWAAIPAVVLPLLPNFGAFVTTVWKDVPFALCEVLITATVLRLLIHLRGTNRGQRPTRLLVALGFEFLGLVLFRNDGFLVLTVIVVILVLALGGLRLKVFGLGIAALAAMLFANAVIYPAAGIEPAASSLSYGLFYADIAISYAEAPSTFTAADKTLMRTVAPLAAWRRANNCYSSDVLFRQLRYNGFQANAQRAKLLSLWFRVLERTPDIVVRARLCRGSIAWNVLPPPTDKANFGEVVVAVPADLYGHYPEVPATIARNLLPHPLSTTLARATHALRSEASERRWQSILWRGATWCYLAYLVLIMVAWRLRRWSVLAIGAAALANQITVSAANPAQLYRYMVGPIFVGMLLIPLITMRRDEGVGVDKTDEGGQNEVDGNPTAHNTAETSHDQPAGTSAR